jgi:hypothetical protein
VSDRQDLRAAIGRALDAARDGDEDRTLRQLGQLVGMSDDPLRSATLELARANADMLLALTGDTDGGLVLGLELVSDDGATVPIDDLEPSLRAAIRIVLSLANGRPADAATQIDLVVASGGPTELGLVVVHTLMWTLQLHDACASIGTSAPRWLQDVMAEG